MSDPGSDVAARPWRSALYIPGDKPRALDKARGLACDAILFDLEDAVAPDAKPAARDTLTAVLRQGGYGHRARIVRVNGGDTPWGADDLAALAGLEIDGVLIPKVSAPAQIAAVQAALPDVPVWAMMETAAGILNAAAIAAAPGLAGMVMGTNDLVRELGCATPPDRAPLQMALQTCVMAARAHGRIILDGVYNAFRDDDGLAAECRQGRALGFDGKTLIHPAQLPVTNEIFAPSEAEIDLARRQIAAWEAAQAHAFGPGCRCARRPDRREPCMLSPPARPLPGRGPLQEPMHGLADPRSGVLDRPALLQTHRPRCPRQHGKCRQGDGGGRLVAGYRLMWSASSPPNRRSCGRRCPGRSI